MDEQILKTLAEKAQQAAESLSGLTIAQVFDQGPRRLFVEHEVPKHGTYRLYIARPFGVRKHDGLRWRVQITVQLEGQSTQTPVNDGHVTVPFEQLGDVIVGAAEQMEDHIKFNGQTITQVRRAAMRVVTAKPDALVVG